MRKTLFALIALSALLAATSLPAKEPRKPKTPKPGYGTVTGRTTTPQEFRPGGSPYERTFTPIRGASITAITSQGDTLRDISDQIGIYALGRVPEGKIIIRVEAKGYKLGDVMNAFRLALVGIGKGPGMFDISAFLGKKETLCRLHRAIETLK